MSNNLRVLFLAAALACAALGAPSWAWAGDGPLVLACSAAYAPFTMRDAQGEPAGLFVDFWNLWSRKTGRPVRFLLLQSWAESLEALRDGRADAHSGLFPSPERQEWMDFSDPFYTQESRLFSLREQGASPSLEQLAGRKVGVVRGSHQERELRRQPQPLDLAVLDTGEDLALALAEGRLAGFVREVVPTTYGLARQGLSGRVAAGPTLFSNPVAVGVRKHDATLLALVNRGLAGISEAEMADLEARWVSNPEHRLFHSARTGVRLTAVELEWLRRHPVLRVGLGQMAPPFLFVEMEGGSPVLRGMAADYLRLVAERLHLRVEPQLGQSPAGSLERGRSKDLDLFPALAPTPERGEYLLFTRPYLRFPQVIVTRADAPFVGGLRDLAGQRVAAAPWAPSRAWLAREHPGVNLVDVDSLPETFTAVATGRADACISDLAAAAHWMSRLGLANLKVAAPAGREDLDLVMGVRRDWPQLVGMLEKALASIGREEEEAIRRRWLPASYEAAAVRPWGLGPGKAALLVLLALAGGLGWALRERRRAERLRVLAESGGGPVLALDRDLNVAYESPQLSECLGYAPGDLLGTPAEALIHPGDLPGLGQALDGFARGARAAGMAHRMRHADGSWRNFESRLTPVPGSAGLGRVLLQARDVTERFAAREALARSEARYALAQRAAGMGAWERDLTNGRITWSDNVEAMFGLAPGQFGGTLAAFLELIHPEDREAVAQAGQRCVEQGLEYAVEFRIFWPDGSLRWIASRGNLVPDAAGRASRFLGVMQDVTERKRMEAELTTLATQDELTRLANRRQFMDAARREFDRARRYGSPLALVMLDADHFKAINDAHGHEAGDGALRGLALAGQEVIREADLFGRLGGEEFALLLPETGVEQAVVVAERLRRAVAKLRIPLAQGQASFTVSLGVAALGPGVDSVDELLRRADQSLYQAKQKGRDRVEIY